MLLLALATLLPRATLIIAKSTPATREPFPNPFYLPRSNSWARSKHRTVEHVPAARGGKIS